MQFIDLKAQYERIQDDVNERVLNVLGSQRYIMGPEVIEAEKQLAEFAGVKHVLTCSSGTDALVIPLMAYGLAATDAVFVPSFTFFASAEAITLAGGTPYFVDIDEKTFNMSPESLEAAIKKVLDEGKLQPRGIVAVDLFGQPADFDKINAIADRYGLFVLEDAAQGFGGKYKGKRAGSLGQVAATSFYPAKPLGCYGDGGAIFTDDDELAELMRSIRVHGGGSDKYDNVRIGVNGRFDSIQAAIILSKLAIFPDELEARDKAAQLYSELFEGLLVTPTVQEGNFSAWAQYSLLAEDENQRTRIIDACKAKNVPICVFYPIPIHLSTAYKTLGFVQGDLPVCEGIAKRVFSVPMHPYLTEEDITAVVNAVKEAL